MEVQLLSALVDYHQMYLQINYGSIAKQII